MRTGAILVCFSKQDYGCLSIGWSDQNWAGLGQEITWAIITSPGLFTFPGGDANTIENNFSDQIEAREHIVDAAGHSQFNYAADKKNPYGKNTVN